MFGFAVGNTLTKVFLKIVVGTIHIFLYDFLHKENRMWSFVGDCAFSKVCNI